MYPASELKPEVSGVTANESFTQKTISFDPIEAWKQFFQDPFEPSLFIHHLDDMARTIEHPIPELANTPLSCLALSATGERMKMGTQMFAIAFSPSSKTYCKYGSLAKMALEMANEQGALDSAEADPLQAETHRDGSGITLLIRAMMMGNHRVLHELTRKRKGTYLIDPFKADARGNTALINYLRFANPIRVDVLDAYASALVQSRSLNNDEAILCRNHYGASNFYGKTALHVLADRLNDASRGNTEEDILNAFKWFSTRIDINIPDAKDKTAFIDICRSGTPEMVREMEQLGADISWISAKGFTALSTATYYDKPEIVHLLFNLDAPKVVSSIEAMTVDRIGDALSIPLLAARQGSWDALCAYLDHCNLGIDTCSSMRENRTPLMYAVRSSEDKVVNRLLQVGAEVNKVDSDGMTAMHYVAGDFDNRNNAATNIFYNLLNAGGSLDLVDSNGRTPLDIILHNGKFQSSSDFFYRVNISQLANWTFGGDSAIAKEYLDSSQFGLMACNGFINQQNPIATNAQAWFEDHLKTKAESNSQDIKQGIFAFNMMTWLSATFAYGLDKAIESNEHQMLTDVVAMIPAGWQLPAITATGIIASLVSTTSGLTDFSQVKKIGSAASYMIKRLDGFFIEPLKKAIRGASPENKGLLGRSLKLCVQMKNYYKRVVAASKAFMRVMKRDIDQPRTAAELIGQMDDKLIGDIARLTRHELTKLHAESKHRDRDGMHKGR